MKKLVPENLNESINNILVPKSLSKEQIMNYAAMKGDLNLFLKQINNGGKLSYSLIRKIGTLYNYYNGFDIIKYLKFHNEILKDISKPEDFEKINNYFNLIKPGQRKAYPPNYKRYRVLKYVDDMDKKNTPVKKRVELIKLIYELGYGPNTFDEIRDASYWSASYMKSIGQYLSKDKNGFYLNDIGKAYLMELTKKFKDIDLKPLV